MVVGPVITNIFGSLVSKLMGYAPGLIDVLLLGDDQAMGLRGAGRRGAR